ncbi:MAG: NUDIX domain-containing protein [Phycisphaerales bacterium]|nr:NUDIX domain-containing protein [Planctomycetota bacterium]
MSDPWTSVPAFGTRDPSRNYTVREGAYAIITNEHARIAIVRTATGLWLPGGGLEPKESHEAALRRELLEEYGTTARCTPTLLRAIEFVDGGTEGCFEKRCVFFAGVFVGIPVSGVAWLSAKDAAHHLRHESQRWAVARLCSRDSGNGGAPSA